MTKIDQDYRISAEVELAEKEFFEAGKTLLDKVRACKKLRKEKAVRKYLNILEHLIQQVSQSDAVYAHTLLHT